MTLITLPVAATIALIDLHRITKSLTKHPRFEFYFGNRTSSNVQLIEDMPKQAAVGIFRRVFSTKRGGSSQSSPRPRRAKIKLVSGEGDLSKPFQVEVRSVNDGEATAHNVLPNLTVHGPPRIETPDLCGEDYSRTSPENTVRRMADGSIVYVRVTGFQHHDQEEPMLCTFVVPMAAQFMNFDACCGAEEVQTADTRLTLRMEGGR